MPRTALTLLSIVGIVLLLFFGTVHALTGETLSAGLRKKLFLLTLQGAPIPSDLQEDPAPPPLTAGERLMRAQAYLSSLITHADIVAERSPLAAEDIRALAEDLLAQSENGEEELHAAFFRELQKIHREIFPRDEAHLLSFKEHAERLLREMRDLPALLEGQAGSKTTARLRQELLHLTTALPYLADGFDAQIFMERLEGVSALLLSAVPETPLALLREDLQELLGQLETYLEAVHGEQADLQYLREELMQIETEEALTDFLTHLEEFMERLSEQHIPLPQSS